MQRINTFVTLRQIERLESLATATGQDRSVHIRLALDSYLDREENRLKKQEDR